MTWGNRSTQRKTCPSATLIRLVFKPMDNVKLFINIILNKYQFYVNSQLSNVLSTISSGKFSQNTTMNMWLNDGVYYQ